MRRVFYFTVVALALAAIAATGTFAFAQNPPPQPPMMGQRGGGPGGGPRGMLRQLNLTDDQRTKVQSLMEQHRQATQDHAQKIRDLEQQLKNAIFADSGPADTTALQGQIAALEAQLQTDRIGLQKQIAAVLTADQRKQVRDMPGPGFGPMMGRGRGRGMGHAPGW
jgi:Spy/CpxP family protein refolding chaperone